MASRGPRDESATVGVRDRPIVQPAFSDFFSQRAQPLPGSGSGCRQRPGTPIQPQPVLRLSFAADDRRLGSAQPIRSSRRSKPVWQGRATSSRPSSLQNGPTREARFPFFFNSNGTVNTSAPNGGVETMFTVTGLQGAGNCNMSAAQLRRRAGRQQRHFPHSDPGVRRRAGREHRRLDVDRRPDDQCRQRLGDQRHVQPQRQRRHDRPIRLEGAEQVAAAVLPARPTTSRWASPTSCSRRIVPCPKRRSRVSGLPAELPEPLDHRLSRRYHQLHGHRGPGRDHGRECHDPERCRGICPVHAVAGSAGALDDHAGRGDFDRQRPAACSLPSAAPSATHRRSPERSRRRSPLPGGPDR